MSCMRFFYCHKGRQTHTHTTHNDDGTETKREKNKSLPRENEAEMSFFGLFCISNCIFFVYDRIFCFEI